MIFRFGAFELDDEKNELRERGRPVRIQPKPLALLALLIRERERVVSADELFAELWPGTVVTPGSLTRAISHARRAIGDTHQADLIKSHARKGYRFCADVVEIEDRSAQVGARAPGAAVGPASAAGPESARPPDSGLPFVGRAHALATLRDAWSQAAAGQGRVVVVNGPAGIGKTRLVELFADELFPNGPLVLMGRAREGEGVPAFWLWAQILRKLLERDEMRAEVGDLTGLAELGGLLPELAETPDPEDSDLSPEQRRFLFFDAVGRVLNRCSRLRPLLIVLEDVQWAGAASLRLLEHLAFETGEEAILIAATVRAEVREPGHPIGRTLATLRQQDRFAQVDLAGFSRGEVAWLLERVMNRPPPSDLTSELYARTEGVPLFVREAIRLLSERGELRRPEQIARRGVRLPSEALDLIRRSLEGLSEGCAKLVGAGSVIGREFSLALVSAVAGESREDALDWLDEAERAGVVEPLPDDAATWRFVHALHGEAAYDGLAAGVRARFHQRTAERLERQHEGHLDPMIAEVAHHRHRGLAVGDPERACEVALQAADRARGLFAYEQVAIHYEQALAALDQCEPVDPGRRLDTLLLLGEAFRVAGDRRRRREVLAQAMESARSLGRPLEFAAAAIRFCDLSEWSPRDEEAESALREALDGLGDEPGKERVRLTTRLAYLAIGRSREEAEPIGRRAIALARGLGDPEALQEAIYIMHYITSGPDDYDERAELVTELGLAAPKSATRDPALIAFLDGAVDRLGQGERPAAAVCGPRPARSRAPRRRPAWSGT